MTLRAPSIAKVCLSGPSGPRAAKAVLVVFNRDSAPFLLRLLTEELAQRSAKPSHATLNDVLTTVL
jgi:hypothetical protein